MTAAGRPRGGHCIAMVIVPFLAIWLGGCADQAAQPMRGEAVTVHKPAGDPEVSAPAAATSDSTVTIEPDVVSYDEYRDPLIHINRAIFGFNGVVSRYVLVPLGKGYARVVPDPVDHRIDDFFSNLATPVSAVNNLLQGKPKNSGHNLLRFAINSTVGLLGLFDPADAWFHVEAAPTGFADTLAHYNAGYGFYVVLPFLGPSDLRSATGRGVDYFLHPVPYLLDQPESSEVMAYQFFHRFAQQADSYETLREQSEDPYLFMRNLHLQGIQRDAAYAE